MINVVFKRMEVVQHQQQRHQQQVGPKSTHPPLHSAHLLLLLDACLLAPGLLLLWHLSLHPALLCAPALVVPAGTPLFSLQSQPPEPAGGPAGQPEASAEGEAAQAVESATEGQGEGTGEEEEAKRPEGQGAEEEAAAVLAAAAGGTPDLQVLEAALDRALQVTSSEGAEPT